MLEDSNLNEHVTEMLGIVDRLTDTRVEIKVNHIVALLLVSIPKV